MTTSIDNIIGYKNSSVIARYKKEFPNNTLSAENAFNELKKFLWICQKHSMDKKNHPEDLALAFDIGIYPEMREIDDMWHTFILFTKEYAEFCDQYFGRFMHHAPSTHEEGYNAKKFEKEFTNYLTYLYDNLGEETVCTWFADLVD